MPSRPRIIVAAACAFLALGWLVLRPDEIYVERVEFEGAGRATQATLRHLADIRNGTTMWAVDLARVEAGVMRHPWVATAHAYRRLPHAVVVEVVEHEPAALLAFEDSLFYVDEQGTPFLQADAAELDYPVLTGITPELEEANDALPRLAMHDAMWLLRELDARKLLARERISEVGFHPLRGFSVRTAGAMPGHPTSEVLFGLGDLDLQLRRLTKLVSRDVDLLEPIHVDLAPSNVAIVRPLQPPRAFLAP